MKYELGILDQYPFEIIGSSIENTPIYIVNFKEVINPTKLKNSIYKAIRFNPLFGTKVGYNKKYFLEDNGKPIMIFNADIFHRPLKFGKYTNDYPWQICYYNKTLTFEWFHSISDGIGSFNFLKDILFFYAGGQKEECSMLTEFKTGLEPFVDKKEKGENFKQNPKGFNNKLIPVHDWKFETRCFVLEASTKEILSVSKENKSIPSCVLAILMSRTLRQFLPVNIKNKNVACNIVVDLRKSLGFETQHNCKDFKRLTYLDYYDDMSFSVVAKQYRKELDEARLPKNIIKIITDRYKMINALHYVKNKNLRKKIMSFAGKIFKYSDCNFVLTYLGKQEYPDEIKNVVDNIQFRTWTDFSDCILACVEYNGKFILNLSSNFVNNEIINTFIKKSEEVGIHWELSSVEQFKQASFIE